MDADEIEIDYSFWMTVEDILSEPIPEYLKRMITAAGYARYSVLKTASNELKAELEAFAREDMTMFQKTAENFHIFYRNPKEFRIVPGHWNLLCEVAKKLPENKKLFLKLQQKTRDPKAARRPILGQTQNTPPEIQPRIQEAQKHALKDSTSQTNDGQIIQTKIKSWLKGKGLSMPDEMDIFIPGHRRATVTCFHCGRSVALSTRDNKNGSWGWIVSNYTQHVLQHAAQDTSRNTYQDTFVKKNTLETYFIRSASSSSGPVSDTVHGEVNGATSGSISCSTDFPQASNPESDPSSDMKGLMDDDVQAHVQDQEIEYVYDEDSSIDPTEDLSSDRSVKHCSGVLFSLETESESTQQELSENQENGIVKILKIEYM